MDNQLKVDNPDTRKLRKGVRNLIRAIAFLLVFTRCFLWVQDLIVPNRDLPDDIRRANKSMSGLLLREPQDSLDILWAGTSHVVQGISPMEIYRDTGIKSHLMSMSAQRAVTAYYLLKQALKRQSPKLFIMDVSAFTYTEEHLKDKNNWQQTIDALDISMLGTRVEMAKKLSEIMGEPFDDEYLRRSVFPLLQYHTHYMLNRYDWRDTHKDQVYYRKGYDLQYRSQEVQEEYLAQIDDLIGYIEEDDLGFEDEVVEQAISETESDIAQAIESNRIYFEDIINLCREHGCEPVFIKIPVHHLDDYRGYWSLEKHNLFQNMADDYGVRFFDLNYEDLGINWTTDTFDGGMHLNYYGAVKVSRFLANWLQDNYSFEPTTDGKLKEQWDTQLGLYDDEIRIKEFYQIKDLTEYLNALQETQNKILVSVNGPVSEFWTDELQSSFARITGCDLDLRSPENATLGLISSNGEVIEIDHNEGQVEYRGSFEGDVAYTVKSSRDNINNPGRISIEHHTLTSPRVGLQIVVYSDEFKCAIDSVMICEVEDEETGETSIVLKRYNWLFRNYLNLAIDDRATKIIASM